jgi:preprotein translocase subunit SecB
MAEQNGDAQPAAPAGPKFSVLAQYARDFSFENPNAPRSLGPQQQSPNISIQINVNARQLAPTDYEVTLLLEGGAGEGAGTLFKFELNYAGVFRLENIPAAQIQPAIMIEGPRLLFPFARRFTSIPSTSTRCPCSASRAQAPRRASPDFSLRLGPDPAG